MAHLCLDAGDALLAACIGPRVWLVDTQDGSIVARLDGHQGDVTAAEFIVMPSALILVSASEDRTLATWDVRGRLLGRTGIEAGAPFTSLCTHDASGSVAVASSDAVIRLYRLGDDGAPALLFRFDLQRELPRYVALKQHSPPDAAPTSKPAPIVPAQTTAVLHMLFLSTACVSAAGLTAAAELLSLHPRTVTGHPRNAAAPVLAIGTSWALVQLDCHARCVTAAVTHAAVAGLPDLAHSAACVLRQCGHVLRCLLGEPFRPLAHLVEYRYVGVLWSYTISCRLEGAEEDLTELSMLANHALLADSPLRRTLPTKG